MSESFAELFEESFASQQIKPGSIIKGTVVAVNDDVVIVSAGLKSEAVIPIEQFRNDMREMKSRSPWMPSKTVSARPGCPARRPSARVPGPSSRKHSKMAKLSKVSSMAA
jgi:hypothetical protein